MDIATALKNLLFLHKIYKIIPKNKIRHKFSDPLRHVKLADDFFNRKINVGDIVTVTGYLSKYCQYFKPRSYAPMVYSPSREEKKLLIDNINKKAQIETSITLGPMRNTFFPVQSLPEYNYNNISYKIAFLYPENFSGFLKSEVDTEARKINEEYIAIPILLNLKDYDSLTENCVKITGMINSLPQDSIEIYSDARVTELTQRLMYNHFRPTSELIGFAIDCRCSFEFSKIDISKEVKIGVFVEGHFENVPIDMYKYDFGNIIDGIKASTHTILPNTKQEFRVYGIVPQVAVHRDEVDEGLIRHYLRDDEINILQKNNIISFYCEYNVNDERSMYNSQSKLVKVYSDTRRKINAFWHHEKYSNSKFELDFIWDSRKISLFHKHGILNSDEFKMAIKAESGLGEIKRWLIEN